MFHNYPYTDFHEINLDWFLNHFKKMGVGFLDLNEDEGTIKVETIMYERKAEIYKVTFRPETEMLSLPVNDNVLAPRTNRVTLYDFAQANDYALSFNSGLSGKYLFNGIEYEDENSEGWYYLIWDNSPCTGFTLHTMPRVTLEPSFDVIKAVGNNCCPIWSPIIENGTAFDYTVLPTTDANYDYIIAQPHPRSVLATKGDDFIFYLFRGRSPYSAGVTYDDMITILTLEAVDNAYNLDGGGSCSCMVSTFPLTIQNAALTTQGRKIVSCIACN